MTRAAPARMLGLADRGHLGAGAARRHHRLPERRRPRGDVHRARVRVQGRRAGGARRQGGQGDRGAAPRGAAGVRPRHRAPPARTTSSATRPCGPTTCAITPDEMMRLRHGADVVTHPCTALSPMNLNGVTIDDTFAEAFGMKATRIVDHRAQPRVGVSRGGRRDRLRHLGDRLRLRGRHRARAAAGRRRPTAGRASSVLLFAMSGKELAKQLERRVGQCVLTSPDHRRVRRHRAGRADRRWARTCASSATASRSPR